MAIVVNDRDLQLEATVPRIAGVSLASNIVVSPSNVTGLGLIIAGTKQVFLSATSQIFQIPKSGSIAPSVITLTANVKNLSETPTLTIASGGGTMSVTPTLTSGSFSFSASQMTTDTVTFLLSLVDSGMTYSDTITVVKCREGIDSVNVVLSNENVTLPADYLGNVTNYGTATGVIKVYQGINDVTSVCSFAVPAGGNPSSLTYSLVAGPSSTGGQYAVTGGFATGTTLASLTFQITFGTVIVNSVFTLSKSVAGAPGTNGTSGTNGQRGSQTFYVALSGTTATYSDSLAASTAASNGGPILNDVVTQYNNSQGFSQTKFWNGTSWVIVNAVVDGNLLVSGTVGANALSANSVTANAIAANSITAKSLVVTDFTNLIGNPSGLQQSIAGYADGWNNFTAGHATNIFSSSDEYYLYQAGRDNFYGSSFPVSAGDQFYFETTSNPTGGGSGDYTTTLGLILFANTPADTSGQIFISGCTRQLTTSGIALTTGVASIPVGYKWARVWNQINTTTSSAGFYYKNLKVQRKNAANLIVDGTITGTQIAANTVTATNINANGLSIYSSTGSLILSAGLPLAAQTTPGSGNICVNSDFSQTASATGGIVPSYFGVYNYSLPGSYTTTVDAGGGGTGAFPLASYWRLVPSTSYTGGTTGAVRFGFYGSAGIGSAVPAFAQSTDYVISFYARCPTSGSPAMGSTFNIAWNHSPATQTPLFNPPLSAGWQRYVFQINWGTNTVDTQFYPWLMGNMNAGDYLDLSCVQVERGNSPSGWALSSYLDNNGILQGLPSNTGNGTSVANTNITISGGNITGIGTGTGTSVANSNITISGGNINGIGTGSGTAVANANITVASGVLTGIGTSGVQVDNSYSLSKSTNSILSATVSINSVTGAGFVAGTLAWDSSGNRTSGYGVAMTPGGLTAYNSSGINTFSLNASTGNAYFAGTLKLGTASKTGASGSLANNTVNGSEVNNLSTTITAIPSGTYTNTGGVITLDVDVNINVSSYSACGYSIYFNPLVDGSQPSGVYFVPSIFLDSTHTPSASYGAIVSLHGTFQLSGVSAGTHSYGAVVTVAMYDATGVRTAPYTSSLYAGVVVNFTETIA